MAPRLSESRRQRRILIIDDEDDLRTLLCEHFEAAGYRVQTAADGNDGIARALSVPPDVVVLDLAMPRLDGWNTMKILRSYPMTRRIPIVACTGLRGDDVATRAFLDGCSGFLEKPFQARDVEHVVDELLSTDDPEETDKSDAG